MVAYTILTETVFQWPGTGFLFLEAINRVDTPLITVYVIFVGLIFAMFEGSEGLLVRLASTMAMGALFGAVWAWLGYRSTGGQRDFTSVSQVVASRYEVLTEHKHAAMGRELLAKLDPRAAAQESIRAAQEAARAQQSGGPGQPQV